MTESEYNFTILIHSYYKFTNSFKTICNKKEFIVLAIWDIFLFYKHTEC